MIPKPNHKDIWTFDFEGKLYIEVCHWGGTGERGDFEGLNNEKGVWNYYITIPERIISDKFEELWLLDKLERFSEASPERVTQDYMSAPFSNVDWHCGITYYEKLGQIKGHRLVKMGCDYSHLYDSDRGFNYTLEEVCLDAMQTAIQLKLLYNL